MSRVQIKRELIGVSVTMLALLETTSVVIAADGKDKAKNLEVSIPEYSILDSVASSALGVSATKTATPVSNTSRSVDYITDSKNQGAELSVSPHFFIKELLNDPVDWQEYQTGNRLGRLASRIRLSGAIVDNDKMGTRAAVGLKWTLFHSGDPYMDKDLADFDRARALSDQFGELTTPNRRNNEMELAAPYLEPTLAGGADNPNYMGCLIVAGYKALQAQSPIQQGPDLSIDASAPAGTTANGATSVGSSAQSKLAAVPPLEGKPASGTEKAEAGGARPNAASTPNRGKSAKFDVAKAYKSCYEEQAARAWNASSLTFSASQVWESNGGSLSDLSDSGQVYTANLTYGFHNIPTLSTRMQAILQLRYGQDIVIVDKNDATKKRDETAYAARFRVNLTEMDKTTKKFVGKPTYFSIEAASEDHDYKGSDPDQDGWTYTIALERKWTDNVWISLALSDKSGDDVEGDDTSILGRLKWTTDKKSKLSVPFSNYKPE